MRFKAVLLDLDGTLLDTVSDIADAANAMRQSLGMPELPLDTLTTYVGKGSENFVIRALSNNSAGTIPDTHQTAHGLALFLEHYRTFNGKRSELYPGVLEGLGAFRKAGLKMAVVTNKTEEFTHTLLIRKGLAHFFDAVVCGDTCERKKPDPMTFLHACDLLDVDPADALAIGDSINDAQAARAAGITVLAVPYGYNEGIDVRSLDVDDIVMSIDDAARWAAHKKE